MTADRRLRIGGWAALLVAILTPLQLAAFFLWPGTGEPAAIAALVAVSGLRIVATLVAVVGLDRLFRSIAPVPAQWILSIGVVGSALLLAVSASDLAGTGLAVAGHGSVDPGLGTWLGLLASVLVGVWFVGGGAILMAAGGDIARIGWSAELGGAGAILTAVAIATRFGGSVGVTGTSLRDWFHLLGLFVVIYLIRTWRFVVGGRLPGPGIL
ncbi:MAG TPA: hypothetical protein VK194_07240 [Candidatus Deferrimicrobium sp.]|nr:hypothetical protein [Candidatus Deferrimicrobium sp.]